MFGFPVQGSPLCDNRSFLLKVYVLGGFIVCYCLYNTASIRRKSINIKIAQMLTDKVIGLSGRGDSITLQQRRSVGLFGKSSTAIIDSIHFLTLKAILRM